MDNIDTSTKTKSIGKDEKLRRTMSWIAVVLIALFAVLALGRVVYLAYAKSAWLDLAQRQFPAMVGLPLSAVAALFVVLVLRMSSGPIEVEIGALKFKGAAAPIVFWLLCFLAIAGAIKMLWLPS